MLTMEFKKFLQVWMLIPCQVIRSGRRLIYRVLQYSDWVPVLLATAERMQQIRFP